MERSPCVCVPVQIVVAELCEAFVAPKLRPIEHQWNPHELDGMFEDTAECLAMFLKDEVVRLEGPDAGAAG
jgi:hypothetical protein